MILYSYNPVNEVLVNFKKFNIATRIMADLCDYYGCEATASDNSGLDLYIYAGQLPALRGEWDKNTALVNVYFSSDNKIKIKFVTVAMTKAQVTQNFIKSGLNITENEVFEYTCIYCTDYTDVGAKAAEAKIIESIDNCIALEDVTIKLREKLLNQTEVAFDAIKFSK